ncbi:MAG: hypothetical protein ACOY0S_04030 [Patescibacteria group bacterium]
MKSVDLTSRVMEKVVCFEKRKIRVWFIRFFLVLLIILTGVIIIGWLILLEVSQRQTLELLALFQQDPEIIAEYWPEVVATIWIELPRFSLGIVGALIAALLLVFLSTRRIRKIIGCKKRELAKH